MTHNPYTLSFGKSPEQIIERLSQMNEIISVFRGDPPTQQAYIITGVRGSGKTVFMTEIIKRLEKWTDWITVELNPERDLLTGIAAKLSSENELARIFRNAKINLSFFGLGLEIKGTAPVTDIEVALSKMLSTLKRHGKKVLIAIDEVVNSQTMREFAHAFQMLLRQDLPVYLLVTGLYDNIYSLQNEKTLTFLYRAPKIHLTPLSIGTIADNYSRTIQLPKETALEMAKLTKGYPFAFQVLGYQTYENGGDYVGALPKYKQYLEEFVYEKKWSELSNTDKKVLFAILQAQTGRIADIRERLGMSTNQFNPYRARLIRKGVVNGDQYGYLRFALPLFDEFVKEQEYS